MSLRTVKQLAQDVLRFSHRDGDMGAALVSETVATLFNENLAQAKRSYPGSSIIALIQVATPQTQYRDLFICLGQLEAAMDDEIQKTEERQADLAELSALGEDPYERDFEE